MGYYTKDSSSATCEHAHRPKTAPPRLDFVESGLRYYNSAIGRWISRDPIGDEVFLSVLFYDATGLWIQNYLFSSDLPIPQIRRIVSLDGSLRLASQKANIRFVDNSPLCLRDFLGLQNQGALGMGDICCSVRQAKQVRAAGEKLNKEFGKWSKKNPGGKMGSWKGTLYEAAQEASKAAKVAGGGSSLVDQFLKDVAKSLGNIPSEPNCVNAIKAAASLDCAQLAKSGQFCAENVADASGSMFAAQILLAMEEFFDNLATACCEAKASQQKTQPKR